MKYENPGALPSDPNRQVVQASPWRSHPEHNEHDLHAGEGPAVTDSHGVMDRALAVVRKHPAASVSAAAGLGMVLGAVSSGNAGRGVSLLGALGSTLGAIGLRVAGSVAITRLARWLETDGARPMARSDVSESTNPRGASS